jgi:hypothetical protein
VSTQQQHAHDDEERDRRQESREHADPARPTHREGEREVGKEGEEKGSEEPRGGRGQTDAERARERRHGTLEDGSELPG